tara:strand:- start:4154 stop:4633 length:480 start_codon:yes stop_codon:yes gene_type:complete
MKVKRDTYEEKSYFHLMALELSGVGCQYRYQELNGPSSYRVKCPNCGCKGAKLDLARRKDNYIFICPPSEYKGCGKVLLLWQLIKEYGSEKIKKDYSEPLLVKKDNWFPIKNRTKKGKNKNKIKPRILISDLHSDWVRLKFLGVLEKHLLASQSKIKTL